MRYLEHFRRILVDAGVESVFVYHLPAKVTRGVLLLSRTPAPVDPELPGYNKTRFQAIVRTTSQALSLGQELADQVSELLTVSAETEIDDMVIKYCRPAHRPMMYPVSNGDLVELSVNFDVAFVDK